MARGIRPGGLRPGGWVGGLAGGEAPSCGWSAGAGGGGAVRNLPSLRSEAPGSPSHSPASVSPLWSVGTRGLPVQGLGGDKLRAPRGMAVVGMAGVGGLP